MWFRYGKTDKSYDETEFILSPFRAICNGGENGMAITALVQDKMQDFELSPDVTLNYGDYLEDSENKMPMVIAGLVIAAVMIFFILVIHFLK